ncbi:MAG: alpha-glucan family phosphorylase [Acidobacteria bacterium]|nr:alpha-glucan family phosphorylase [Acidobacteriota bacterium]
MQPRRFGEHWEISLRAQSASSGQLQLGCVSHHRCDPNKPGGELGITEEQIKELDRTGRAQSRLKILAPIGGTVIEKPVTEGRYVKKGDPLYSIADLSVVWLMLELFPDDAAQIRYGQRVEAEVQSLPGEIFSGRVAFVDDYDLHVAHFLVQGCDVWLNNPRKPLEASGTSGMKAALNGIPHLSIGDGWWAEGYAGDNGWLIDGGEHTDHGAMDAADADALYTLLERDVVPTFYDRDRDDLPRRWLTIVRQAIRTVAPRFTTRRMVKEYVEQMYAPAIRGSGYTFATDNADRTPDTGHA